MFKLTIDNFSIVEQVMFLRNVSKGRPWLSLWESWLGKAETERAAEQRETFKKQQANSYKRNHIYARP